VTEALPHHGIFRPPDAHPAAVYERQLVAQGWSVLTLRTGIHDRQSFFESVAASVPLDPPLEMHGDRLVWDALSDSVFGGLDELAPRVVIMWPNSSQLAATEPAEYETAVDVLTQVAETLADRAMTDGQPTRLVTLLL
jgi:hypothetical protein